MNHPKDKKIKPIQYNDKDFNPYYMLLGFKEDETNKVYTRDRDRYGAKEKKRLQEEEERRLYREEEKKLKRIPRLQRLYNNWTDLTKTKFWKKEVKTNITYHGVHTRFNLK